MRFKTRLYGIIMSYIIIGWAFCGILSALGMSFEYVEDILMIHTLFIPILLMIIYWFSFNKYHSTPTV